MGGRTVEAEVLEQSGRRCCICFGLYRDLECKRGQIAHLDHNHQNNDIDNLAFLCLPHHDEYDTRNSQSKSWTIEEAKRYRDTLYEAIEDLRHNETQRLCTNTRRYELPVLSAILSASSMVMDAVDKNTGEKHSVSAYPLNSACFTFDMTNPNQFDMRITRLYVDVVKFMEVNIIGVWENGLGGGRRFRDFSCEIEPKIARYDCIQTSEDFEYIKLSYAEMEAFRIHLEAIVEGIYRLRLGIEYSIGGETRRIEVDNDVQEIGIFDTVFHQPSHDWSTRVIEA